MSGERKPFAATTVPEIDEHLQERLREVEANFANDKAYPKDAVRKIILEIAFVPDKDDPDEVDIAVFSATKLPKRRGKRTAAVLRKGKVYVEDFPEQEPLFGAPKVVGGNSDD